MKKMFILALILFWSLPAGADSFPETAPHIHVSLLGVSSMDWTRNRIVSGGAVYFRAEGEDVTRKAVLAERKGRIRALKNLYDSLGETYLDSSSTISHIQNRNPGVARDFSAMVQQAEVVEIIRNSGSGHLVEVFVMLDLWNEQTRLFMPNFMFKPVETVNIQNDDFLLTGDCVIYIDATGIDVSPAIIPAITDNHGNVLFRASILGSDKRAGQSSISYIRSSPLEHSFPSIRDPGQRVWIKAQDATGDLKTDIRLDTGGAEKLTRVVSSTESHCSVNIILK